MKLLLELNITYSVLDMGTVYWLS